MSLETEVLYHQFSNKLLGFIESKVKDKALAQDILHDAFVKIHMGIDGLRDQEKLVSWMYQLTRNLINDHFKKAAYHYLDATWQETEEEESGLSSCLQCVISILPRHYKTPVFLVDVKGFSQKEAADRLKIGYSATKSRVQRGRKIIAQHLLNCVNHDDLISKSQSAQCTH